MSGPRPPRRRRALSAEEQALWREVARGLTPLDPSRSPEAAVEPAAEHPVVPAPAATPAAKPTAPPVPTRRLRPIGRTTLPPVSYDLADTTPAPVGRPEAGIDRRNAERLRRGERTPDGRIDLHGMTAERAHRALDRRIAEGLARGERVILVITGKGGRQSNGSDAPFMRSDRGILRQQVPRWLRSGQFASEIVGIYEAHLRHGGAGALYVYLKKRR